MIPPKLVDFLHGPVVLVVGTRSDGLMPAVTYGRGAVVDAENDVITVIVPDVESEATLDNLARNGAIALTAGNGVSHETYQFKGRCLEVGPSDAHHAQMRDALIAYKAMLVRNYGRKGGKTIDNKLPRQQEADLLRRLGYIE